MSDRLKGKVALITGAAQGIGRATALLFAGEGATLVLTDKNDERLQAVVKEVQAAGARAVAVKCDVARKADLSAAAAVAKKAYGALHILINNAGVTLTRPFIDTSDDDIDFLVDINLKGTIFASQAAVPYMREAGGGSIVHNASNAGLVGRPWQSVYGATKAGIVSLTKSMALSLARDRVRVNCVCPGSIDTPMLRGALSASGNFDDNWRKTEMVIPLGRIGSAEDIARANLFLASDESAYITGIALPVDGGRTAGIAEVSHLNMVVSK